MSEEIRLTRDIHNFVRGQMSWKESFWLLVEVAEFLSTATLIFFEKNPKMRFN